MPLPEWLEKKWSALERELDFRVLATSTDGEATAEGRFELVGRARPQALDGATFYAALPVRVLRAIRRHRPEVVVAEDPPAAAAALVARRLAPRHLRPRVIAEVHGNWRLATREYGSPARRLVAPLADAVDGWAVRRADAVRGLSPYTDSLVEDVRGEPPAASFPTYSDLSAFTGPARRPLPETPNALFVGVLERYKNIEVLAEAWRAVTRDVPGARLTVVGRGTLQRVVDALVAQHPQTVEHLRELSPAQVAQRMDESWVLALPSRHEGLGRVVIESFARGRGVVATRAGGILDLVDDGVEGLLVEVDDVDGLAGAMRRVLTDRALAEQLGDAAARRFEDWRTTPEEYARRVRELVDRALH